MPRTGAELRHLPLRAAALQWGRLQIVTINMFTSKPLQAVSPNLKTLLYLMISDDLRCSLRPALPPVPPRRQRPQRKQGRSRASALFGRLGILRPDDQDDYLWSHRRTELLRLLEGLEAAFLQSYRTAEGFKMCRALLLAKIGGIFPFSQDLLSSLGLLA